MVTLFLPMFDRVTPERYPEEAEFLAPVVARALVRQGRPAEARTLLIRVGAAMPKNEGGNDLNILAATMLLDANQLNWTGALAQADAFLTRARQLGPNINASATLQVQALRACALTGLGRATEAEGDAAAVLIGEAVMPAPAMQLHLCRGETIAGGALVVRRLADPRTRDWALRFVQPTRSDADTPFEKMTEPVENGIRALPEVRAAAEKVGRILPQPVLTGLPDGFDPYRSRPVSRPLGQDAT